MQKRDAEEAHLYLWSLRSSRGFDRICRPPVEADRGAEVGRRVGLPSRSPRRIFPSRFFQSLRLAVSTPIFFQFGFLFGVFQAVIRAYYDEYVSLYL